MLFNKEEVCKKLNLSRVVLDHLITKGYIKTNQIEGFRYLVITQMEIDNFKKRLEKEAKVGNKNIQENWKKIKKVA